MSNSAQRRSGEKLRSGLCLWVSSSNWSNVELVEERPEALRLDTGDPIRHVSGDYDFSLPRRLDRI